MTAKDESYIIAIDHGSSAVKSAIVSVHGEIVDAESRAVSTYFFPNGGAEQDPEEWWRAAISTIQCLLQKRSVPSESIAAIICSSTFSSTVAVDVHGRSLGRALTWMDSRGAPYVRDVMSGFPSIQGYNLFKLFRWIRKSAGGPQLSGKDDAAHLLWWKHACPDLYRKIFMVLGSKDYFNLRLTGRFAASFDAMTLFWLCNTRRLENIHYDAELINMLGIDSTLLPPMRSSFDILGPLIPEVAAMLGLSPRVQVITGSPDHQSAGIGSGAVGDFEAHLYIGTSSWIQALVPFKKTDIWHSIASLPSPVPGRYYCANEQDSAGACLSYLVHRLMYGAQGLHSDCPPADVYCRLDDMASRVPPGSQGLFFTPWLNGERTPVDNPWIRASFFNLSFRHTFHDMVRAVLEGVAYNQRWALRHIERFMGKKIKSLRFIGGGAQSAVWCQILADILGRTIERVDKPLLANARGAALIAAVALGRIRFEEIPTLVPVRDVFYPNPLHSKLYDRGFELFLKLYRAHKHLCRDLNSMPSVAYDSPLKTNV